jgi:hypothetical protein
MLKRSTLMSKEIVHQRWAGAKIKQLNQYLMKKICITVGQKQNNIA